MGSDVVRRKSFGAGLGCLCLAPPAKLRPGQVGVSQLGSDVEDVCAGGSRLGSRGAVGRMGMGTEKVAQASPHRGQAQFRE